MRIVVATSNRYKIAELGRVLAGLDAELVPMSDFDLASPVEDGETFEANALIKARAACAGTGLPAVADDSGLEVDALGGAPGVHSARYASHDQAAGTDNIEQGSLANNRKLVRELVTVDEADRTARFVCAAALVTPEGGEWVERGTMPGRIIDQPRGQAGFGYDPHFVSEGETRTNAELTPQEKDARSHRGAAFRALRRHIERLATD